MLEKEFGNKNKEPKEDDSLVDQNGKPVGGAVNNQGRLVIAVGPKKRVFIKVLQILLALTAAVPSIYAALVSFPISSLYQPL